MSFFFLDEKETKSQDKTICCARAKLLCVLSGLCAASERNYLHKRECGRLPLQEFEGLARFIEEGFTRCMSFEKLVFFLYIG